MILYYASVRLFNAGQTLAPFRGASPGHALRVGNNEPWRRVEEAFERNRLADEHSRYTSYFASASAADAAAYMQSQQATSTTGSSTSDNAIKYYKVDMPGPTRCVMNLCGQALKHLSVESTLVEIAREYWRQPAGQWEYFEYLAPTMTILEQVGPPNTMDVATSGSSYTNDHDTARRRWPV